MKFAIRRARAMLGSSPAQPGLLVGIGTSGRDASGRDFETLTELVAALPEDSGMVFLLTQSPPALLATALAERLAACTAMPVREAEHDLLLQANTLYIVRPDSALAVRRNRIQLRSFQPGDQGAPGRPLNRFFAGLARQDRRTAGILLSGPGQDGSAGLREIKAAGGLAIALASQSGIDAGVVDLILEARDMPATLERFANLSSNALSDASDGDEATPSAIRSSNLSRLSKNDLAELTAVLATEFAIDLRVYKSATVERRVLRRMLLTGVDSVQAYLADLRRDTSEQRLLMRDLLINVTEFFRDPQAFQSLRKLAIEPLVASSAAGATLRVWVPGCATGEEPYSIAIEFLEAINAAGKMLRLQIFATDINRDAVAFARAGVYPSSIAERISKQRLQTYFNQRADNSYKVRPLLRDLVSFAEHDLTQDPPFSRMSLVSCRNVLIYLTPESQEHVLKLLHFALVPDGQLLLSTSESTGTQSHLFSTVSKSQRLYRKSSISPTLAFPAVSGGMTTRDRAANSSGRAPGSDLGRIVLDALVPPTIIIAGDNSLLFSHGELGPYLRIPQGQCPRLELSSLLRPNISVRVRGALAKCRRSSESVRAIHSLDGAGGSRVCIEARPLPSLGDGAVLLSFDPIPIVVAGQDATRAPDSSHDAIIEQLEAELRATHGDLHSTIEELETTNEELHASNERSMSVTEELQSANEELEATGEELRSLNEELTTVNSQLRMRARQHSVIGALGLHALREDNVQDFMDHAVREVQNTLDTDYCKILELQSEGDKLLLRAGAGWQPGLVGSAVVGAGLESQAGYTLRATEPVLVNDMAREERFSNSGLLTDNEVVSGISCVIRDANHHGYGVIGAHTSQHRVFVREDIDFLQAVAGLIGSAISRHQARVRLALELSVANVLAKAVSLDEAIAPLVKSMTGDLRASLGECWWPAQDGSDLMCRHLYVDGSVYRSGGPQDFGEEFGRRTFKAGEGLVGKVYQDGRARWCTELNDPDIFGRPNEAAAIRLLSGFCFPISAGNNVLGVITLFSSGRMFGDSTFLRGLESIGRALGHFALRVQAEDRSRASEARKAAMVNASLDGIITMDREGRVVEFNAAAREMFQYREDETIGHELAALIVPERLRDAHRTALARVVAGHRSRILGQRVELPAVRRDGSEFRVELAITQIGDPDEPLYTGFVRDMTEQKRMEDALREAARQKDEFLAMLGHELRNPLAAIRSAAELLKLGDGGNASPQLQRTQAVLSRQTAHMAKLLDGLLDVSRIIRGKIQLDREIVDLATICPEVATDLVDLQGRNLDIQTRVPTEPVWVEGDRVRLAQIVDNLLSNAIKYTGDGGTVKLSLTCEKEQVILCVSDTGIGIEPELLPHIFEVFRQSEQSIDRSHGGLGLGLALVKSLVELQGGTIEVRSAGKGCGAAFIVRLPQAIRVAAQTVSPTAVAEGPMQILLIEDNEDAAEMMQQVLELWGYQVLVAFRGQEGLNIASEKRPQVVLCDLGLPDGMTGFDVAARLRADPEMGSVRLVALSGYGRPEDKARGAKAGFNAHLTKPVDLGTLRRLLASIGEEAAPAQVSPRAH